MNIRLRIFIGSCLPLGFITVLLILLIPAIAFPSNDTAKMGMPDIMILISMKGDDMASFAYPKLVSKERVMNDLARFTKECNWSIDNIKITNDGRMQSSEIPPSTSVDFIRTDSGKYDTSRMDIAPMITAFKGLDNIQIIFMAPTTWQFSGVQNFEDRYVKIDLSGSRGSYQYKVHIKDHKFDKLVLPVEQTETRLKLEPKKGGSGALYIFLVILLALATAVLVFLITKYLTTKREPNSSRRS